MHVFVVLYRLIEYMIGLEIEFLIRKKKVKRFDRSKKCDVTEINLNLRCTNHSQNVSVVLKNCFIFVLSVYQLRKTLFAFTRCTWTHHPDVRDPHPAEVNNPQLTWSCRAQQHRTNWTNRTWFHRCREALVALVVLLLRFLLNGLCWRHLNSRDNWRPTFNSSLSSKMAAADEASRPFAGLSDVSISEDIPVEGDISVPMGSSRRDDEFSTLDEPVKETILRDLRAVGNKFIHVLYPKRSSALLRDWDLWGPLLLCVTLALLLQGGSADSDDQGGPQFAEVLHFNYLIYLSVWSGWRLDSN